MRERLDAERTAGDYVNSAKRRVLQAVLGDGAGNVVVPNRAGWVFARLHGNQNYVIKAWSPNSIPFVNDLVVDVELSFTSVMPYYVVLGRSTVIRYDQDPFMSSGITGAAGQHASQHVRRDRNAGGYDPLDVYTRALTTLRAQAQSTPDMTVFVASGYYYIDGFNLWAGGNSPAFDVPTFGGPSRYDLLCLGAGGIQIIRGVDAAWGDTPIFPTVPTQTIPIAFIYLTSSMAAITEANIIDARVVLTAATTPTGGSAPANDPFLVWKTSPDLPNSRTALELLGRMENDFDLQMTLHVVRGG